MKKINSILIVVCSILLITMIGCGSDNQNDSNIQSNNDSVISEGKAEESEPLLADSDEATEESDKPQYIEMLPGFLYDTYLSQDEQEKVGDSLYDEYCVVYFESINDESWKGYFNSMKVSEATLASMYKVLIYSDELSEDELAEQYRSMSEEDRDLWATTYLSIANQIYKGRGEYTSSYKDMTGVPYFAETIFNNPYYDGALNKDLLIEKYENLMHWQFEYLTQYGGPYCFQTHHSYLEEITGEF